MNYVNYLNHHGMSYLDELDDKYCDCCDHSIDGYTQVCPQCHSKVGLTV